MWHFRAALSPENAELSDIGLSPNDMYCRQFVERMRVGEPNASLCFPAQSGCPQVPPPLLLAALSVGLLGAPETLGWGLRECSVVGPRATGLAVLPARMLEGCGCGREGEGAADETVPIVKHDLRGARRGQLRGGGGGDRGVAQERRFVGSGGRPKFRSATGGRMWTNPCMALSLYWYCSGTAFAPHQSCTSNASGLH